MDRRKYLLFLTVSPVKMDMSHSDVLGRKHSGTVSTWGLGSEVNASARIAYVKYP